MDNATITLNSVPARGQKTEPHGKFAFFETTPGSYTLTATAPDSGTAVTNVTIAAGANVALNLALPPDLRRQLSARSGRVTSRTRLSSFGGLPTIQPTAP